MHSAVKIIIGLVLISGIGVGVYFAITNDNNSDSENTTTYTYLPTTVVTTNPNTCQNHTHCEVCEFFWFSLGQQNYRFSGHFMLHKIRSLLNIQNQLSGIEKSRTRFLIFIFRGLRTGRQILEISRVFHIGSFRAESRF